MRWLPSFRASPIRACLFLRMEIARALETATDYLAHAAFALRDRVLGEFRHETLIPRRTIFFSSALGARKRRCTAELAGSKAANLWQMAKLGLKVPPAFVLPTRLCQPLNAGDVGAEELLGKLLAKGIAGLEDATGARFWRCTLPLLVSVRSGAARSMPGMLDTILNIGMTPQTVHGLIRLTGNPRLAWDSYRRFVQSYTEVTGNTGAEALPPGLPRS